MSSLKYYQHEVTKYYVLELLVPFIITLSCRDLGVAAAAVEVSRAARAARGSVATRSGEGPCPRNDMPL